jgi:hypothetical protein
MAGVDEIRTIIAGLVTEKDAAKLRYDEAAKALADALAALKPVKAAKTPGEKKPRKKKNADPLVAVPYRDGWRCPGSVVTHKTKEEAEAAARETGGEAQA